MGRWIRGMAIEAIRAELRNRVSVKTGQGSPRPLLKVVDHQQVVDSVLHTGDQEVAAIR